MGQGNKSFINASIMFVDPMYNAIAHYIIPPLKEQCYSNKMELQYA